MIPTVVFEVFWTFLRISLFTFGGGYAMIPLFQRELVENHGWVTHGQILDMITVAEITPGPLAINLGTFAGYRAAGFWGAVAANLGLIVPSLLLIILIASFLRRFQELPLVQGILRGVRPMVVVLIAVAALSVARTALGGSVFPILILLAALVASIVYKTHPLVIILASGLLGLIMY